jgi:serine protease Do
MMDVIQTPIGTRAPVAFDRHGKPMQAEVTVAPWTQVDRGEAELMHTMAEAQAAGTPGLGVILAPITDLARRLYNITTDKGVVVAAVDPASDAFTQGIIPGDVVEKVQDQVVTSPDQAMGVAKQAMARDRFIALLVASKNGGTRWVPIYSGRRPAGAGSELVSSGGEPKQPDEAQTATRGQARKP